MTPLPPFEILEIAEFIPGLENRVDPAEARAAVMALLGTVPPGHWACIYRGADARRVVSRARWSRSADPGAPPGNSADSR